MTDFDRFQATFEHDHPWLPAPLALRYGRAYGTRVTKLLGDARRLDDLGEHLGDGLYAAELGHLMREEFAMTAEDILWRRSKQGLHVSEETAARVRAWLGRNSEPRRGEADDRTDGKDLRALSGRGAAAGGG
jgi:glycerol-3-phosphate dehydrogenase